MPSPRRVKVFGIMIFLAAVTFLLWSASYRQQRVSDLRHAGDFYEKTLNALDQEPGSKTTVDAGSEDSREVSRAMTERLKEAAQLAKDKANKKAPKPDNPSDLVGVGSAAEGARDEKGVAGRKKYQPIGPQEATKEETESEEDVEAEAELNSILKKSPSKSFFSPGGYANLATRIKSLHVYSNHILEILLPALSTREDYPPREVRHRPHAVRGRAGPAPPWRAASGPAEGPHREEYRAERSHQRGQHWRRR